MVSWINAAITIQTIALIHVLNSDKNLSSFVLTVERGSSDANQRPTDIPPYTPTKYSPSQKDSTSTFIGMTLSLQIKLNGLLNTFIAQVLPVALPHNVLLLKVSLVLASL